MHASADWLDSLDESGLHETYDWFGARRTEAIRNDQWAAAYVWRQCQHDTMDALSRLYRAETDPSFSRRQMPLDGLNAAAFRVI